MENKRKYLEFIQGVINRMAGNSFFLKAWTVTFILALLTFFIKNVSPNYIFIVCIPIIIFWILDGYFLSQEQLFRALYDHARKLDEKEIDFSMKTGGFKTYKNSWLGSIFSTTLLIFYLTLVGVVLIVMCLIK